jgi:hypothetical protein
MAKRWSRTVKGMPNSATAARGEVTPATILIIIVI